MEHLTILLLTLPGVFSLTAESNIVGWEGGSVAVQCKYELQKYRDHMKYWCKGYTWHTCNILRKSNSPQQTSSRVTIHDDKKKGIFTVILSELKREDNGRYACGIEISGVALDKGVYIDLTVSDKQLLWVNSPMITAQEGGAVSIQCHYFRDRKLSTKQWFREGEWDFSRTETADDKVTISVNHTWEVFTLSMKRLEMKDTGRYWCAIDKGGAKMGAVIQLKVTAALVLQVSSSVITAQEGGAFSIQCHYAADLTPHVKYWCRGDEWSSCENLVQSGICTPGDKRILNDDKTQAVFTVSVSRLDMTDTGHYWCVAENNQVKLGTPVELRVEASTLPLPSEITGQEGGAISIQCHYSEDFKFSSKYWQRGLEWSSCETLTSVTFEDDQTYRRFPLSRSRLDMTDSGHYWCVVEYSEVKLGTPLELRVKASSLLWINDPVVTGIRGGMVSILCHYTQDYKHYVKQWCKGEEWKSCEIVAQSMMWKVGDKVRLDDDESQGIFTVNVRALEMTDAGQYWCVMESNGVKLGTAVELIVNKVIPSTETSTSGIPPTVQTSSDMPSFSHKEKAFISLAIMGSSLILLLALSSILKRYMTKMKGCQVESTETPQLNNEMPTHTATDSTLTSRVNTVENNRNANIQNEEIQLTQEDINIVTYATVPFKQKKIPKQDDKEVYANFRSASVSDQQKKRSDKDDNLTQEDISIVTYATVSFMQKKIPKQDNKPHREFHESVTYSTLAFHENRGQEETLTPFPASANSDLYTNFSKNYN